MKKMFISKISLLMFTSLCVATRKEDSYTRSINKYVKSISELANHANFAKRIDPYARINNLKSDIELDDEIAPKFKNVNVSYLNCILGDLVGLGLSIQSETEIQSTRSLNQLHGDSLLAAVMDLAKQADEKNNPSYESSVDDAASAEGRFVQLQEKASYFERENTSLVEQLREAEERLEGTQVNVVHSNLESKKIQNLEKEKAALTTQLEEAKHSLEQARANVNESLEAEQAKVTSLKKEKETLANQLAQARANQGESNQVAEIERLQKLFEENRNGMVRAEKRETEAKQSLEEIRQELKALKTEQENAKKKLAQAEVIMSNRDKETNWTNELDDLEAKVKQAKELLNAEKKKLADIKNDPQNKRLTFLEDNFKDVEVLKAQNRQNVQAFEDGMAKRVEAMKVLEKSIELLQNEKTQAEKREADLKAKIAEETKRATYSEEQATFHKTVRIEQDNLFHRQTEELSSKKAKLIEVTKNLETSIAEKKALQEKLTAAQQAVANTGEAGQALVDAQNQVKSLEAKLAEATEKLASANTTAGESLEEQKATIATLEAKLVEATEKLASANTTASESLEAQKATITTLEAKLAEATEKLASANTTAGESFEEQKATITTLEAKLAEATQRLESNNTNTDESLQVEQDKVKSLEAEKADLEEKLAEAAQNLQAKVQANAGQAESLKEAQDKANALASEKVDLAKKFADNIEFLNMIKATLGDACALEDKDDILETILAILESFQVVDNSAVNEGNLSLIPQTTTSQLVSEHLSQTHHDSKSDEGLHEVNSAAGDMSEQDQTSPHRPSQQLSSAQASPLGEDLIFVQIKSKGVQNPEFFRIKRSDAETFGLNEVENTSGKGPESIAMARVEGKNLKTGRANKIRNLISLK